MNITISPTLYKNYAANSTSIEWLKSATRNITALLQRLGVIRWEQISSDWTIVIRAVTADETVVYLKACPPSDETNGAACSLLGHCHPQLVRCIFADFDLGIHVLENVPGIPLSSNINTAEDLQNIGHLLLELNQLNTQPGMIPLSRWCRDLLHPPSTLPDAISRNVERCRALVNSSNATSWVHGDLHHGNIIQLPDTGNLVAIDPKGIVGDPCFDICTFVRNHIPSDLDDDALSAFLERRIRMIGEAAKYPMDRAFGWAAAGNALSLLWDLPQSGFLETEHQQHLYRVLLHLNDLAEHYGST
jgi:hypothetical protein